ncbi:hypothetical protein C8R45DRAFT_1099534 [Mycena sanguinolenta]|nr:hypothetical protein C8R45DRAFT_1099534 [Mycena sanguinolenta]
MASEADQATQFNNEARKLFDEGKFEAAGKLYERANKADTLNSPIYVSNLALVHLKLKQFEKAEICATMALCRDPRSIKARYRRAMAGWKRGRSMQSLVDLASVLTLDPMDKAAVAAFATVSKEYESLGSSRGFLDPMEVLKADYPSPYGSPAAPRPPTPQNVSRANGVVIPNCSTAFYCDEVCQRKHWPTHKKDCIPYDKVHVLTLRICNNLMDHEYTRLHLKFYALRSIGALHHSPPPYCTVLLVFVELVPVESETGPRPRRRIRIRNLVTAPLVVLHEKARESYHMQTERMRKTCGMPGAPGVAILITPLHENGQENNKSRTLMAVERLVPDLAILIKDSGYPVGVESRSFGVGRKLTTDLDDLYW